MTYSESIHFLCNLRIFGTRLGLENTLELARLMGHPQERLRFIHVAGTNGKGSTCAILESIYRANGQQCGLFTSPHLISFTERIQVDRVCIAEADVARLTAKIIAALGGPDVGEWRFCPTFFEVVAVMALLFFDERRCDLVIWETGLGGRLDATNIVTPLASVITNIQKDHQQWLGSTLEQIAIEKAGIIKPGIPVITGADPGPALEVIRATAHRSNAPCVEVDAPIDLPDDFPLPGEHQRMNATVALAAINSINAIIPVSDRAIAEGLRTVRWAGRLQMVQRGGCQFLLDGAHNADGARTLATTLRSLFPGRRFALVLGVFRDKPWKEMCEWLVPVTERLLLVPLQAERTADIAEMRQVIHTTWPDCPVETHGSVREGIDIASRDEPFVVIAGSLHLVGEAMEILGIAPDAPSERALNEWDAANSATRAVDPETG